MNRERRMVANRRSQILAFVVAVIVTTGAHADFSVTQTVGDLSARVSFAQDGNNLSVTLENISMANVAASAELLTGVFFDISGATLNPLRAALTAGSWIEFADVADQDPDNPIRIAGDGLGFDRGFRFELGGEWGYRSDLPPGAIPTGATHVIASAGLDGLLGADHLLPGENLDNPIAPDGMNSGILSTGNIAGSGNPVVTGAVPLINNGVIFTFSGLPGSFDLENNISAVTFNYGTDLNVIPAPPAVLLALMGLGLAGWVKHRAS